jgi:hypothetical protein
MVAFARFETDAARDVVMVNVEKIVKFRESGWHTRLFLDDGSTVNVKGNLLYVVGKIAEATKQRDHFATFSGEPCQPVTSLPEEDWSDRETANGPARAA